MNFLSGKGTFLSSIVAIIFGLLLAFGIDLKALGITEDQITGMVLTLGAIIAIFLRRGSKNDAANTTVAVVTAMPGTTDKEAVKAGESVGTATIVPADAKTP